MPTYTLGVTEAQSAFPIGCEFHGTCCRAADHASDKEALAVLECMPPHVRESLLQTLSSLPAPNRQSEVSRGKSHLTVVMLPAVLQVCGPV
jgi:hypothetical protein